MYIYIYICIYHKHTCVLLIHMQVGLYAQGLLGACVYVFIYISVYANHPYCLTNLSPQGWGPCVCLLTTECCIPVILRQGDLWLLIVFDPDALIEARWLADIGLTWAE